MNQVRSPLISSTQRKVVVGLGATGLSVARFLWRKGDEFAVVDTRALPPGLEALRREFPEVPVFVGEEATSVIDGAGELIVSPGVALDEPLIADALAQGASLRGDIDLFVAEAKAPVVGITGSNAKSTVTAMLGAMARAADVEVAVGGNLGTPALDLLDEDVELYVLELSSFQLERAGNLNLDVATVLNVTPDHLDRHGSMQRYHQAKHKVYAGARCVVINSSDPLTIPPEAGDRRVVSWRPSQPDLAGWGLRVDGGEQFIARGFDNLMPVAELSLPGAHNVKNALACLALGDALDLSPEAMVSVLREFPGLPHRCELVTQRDGIRWINDSKATNVGAALAAIEGLGDGRNLVLIAGGRDKDGDYRPLRSALAEHCELAVFFGEARDLMADAVGDGCPIACVATLEDAVGLAASTAVAGQIVLLSPACASFDQFASYEARGAAFAALARKRGDS